MFQITSLFLNVLIRINVHHKFYINYTKHHQINNTSNVDASSSFLLWIPSVHSSETCSLNNFNRWDGQLII